MRRRMNGYAHLAMLLVLVTMTGCAGLWVAGGAAAAGGTGAYVYSRGTYRAVLNAPLFQSDQALRNVCSQANLIELARTCNGYRSTYRFQDVHENKVKFQLRAVTPETTRIYIRVGRCGDKDASHELLQAIDRHLQAMPRG